MDNDSSVEIDQIFFDPNSVMFSIPQQLGRYSKLEIIIFSNHEQTIPSFSDVRVDTGVFINSYLPATHHLVFESYFNENLIIQSKMIPFGHTTLDIYLMNTTSEDQIIPCGVPLGKLSLKPNESPVFGFL